MNINPKTPAELIRFANCARRAESIVSEGTYQFVPDADYPAVNSVAVCEPKKLAAKYWITDGECNCPDFQKHGDFCKHVLAWKRIQDENEEADKRAEEEADIDFIRY